MCSGRACPTWAGLLQAGEALSVQDVASVPVYTELQSFRKRPLEDAQTVMAANYPVEVAPKPSRLCQLSLACSAVSDEREKGPEAGIILAQGMIAAEALPGARLANMRAFTCTAWDAVVPSLLTVRPAS